jgi:HD-like signal output (HDOD) protein
MEPSLIKASHLKHFSMFKHTDIASLEGIACQATIHEAKAKEYLTKIGDSDSFTIFLLRGSIQLHAKDGQIRKITAGSEKARNPLSRLKPHLYDTQAVTDIVYMKIPDNSLMYDATHPGNDDTDIEIDTVDTNTSHLNNELTYDIYNALAENKLKLPSLPDIAIQVSKAVRQDSCNANNIAKIIQNEPVIIAKLLHTANSALYGGTVKIKTPSNAIARLGLGTTKKLVVTFCILDIYKTNVSLLKTEMQKLREKSIQVAAISAVISHKLNLFDPEEALLAGLMHNIGSVAILDHIRKCKDLVHTKKDIFDAIRLLQAEISAMILRKWEMDDSLIQAALHANNWKYSHNGGANLADIVILANMHSMIGTKHLINKPAINELPAYSKLGLVGFNPKSSLSILDEAKQDIAEITAALSL